MAAIEVFPPFQVFCDVNGDPLEDGYIYIGLPSQNPQTVPANVYWDESLTIQAAQPIRTIGGYPSRNGTPSRFFVGIPTYSITVANKNEVIVYNLPESTFGNSENLRSDLANQIDNANGSGMVGYKGRTVNARLSESTSVEDFSGNDDVKAQSAINAGGSSIRFPSDAYSWSSGVTIDYSSPGFNPASEPSSRVSIIGDSLENTIIDYSGANGSWAITKVGPASFASNGVYGNDMVYNIVLNDDGETNTRHGIRATNLAYCDYARININGFNTGLSFDSCLSSKFDHVVFNRNTIGTSLDNTTAQSLPNANTFDNCEWNGNSQAGIIGNKMGATNRFSSCRFEQNGSTGGPISGGLIGNIDGGNGTAAIVFESCYFENNGGVADVYLTNISALDITVVFIGCTFNRGSAAKYTTNNIALTSTGGGKIKCVLVGCGFWSTGDYVPDAGRPFILEGTGVEVIDIGCTYSETTSKPISTTLAIVSSKSTPAANGVATAVYSLPNVSTPSVYDVSVNIGSIGDAVNYGASAKVYTDGASARIVNTNIAVLQDIALSGLDIMSTQTSGSAQTIECAICKVG